MRFVLAAFASLSLAVLACGGNSVGSTGTESAADTTDSHAGGKDGTCTSSDQCTNGDYCALTSGASCTSSGKCQPLPFACPQICEPVCGCDGRTYDNYCDAEQALTNPAFSGFCEHNPATGCWGNSAGAACSPTTAESDCNPIGKGAGYKGGANGTSNLYCASSNTCATIPSGCDSDGGPVCGTDGKTYDNACKAYWDGRVGVASPGECGQGADAGAADAGPACQTANDCMGLLPDFCAECADGTSQCAHWDCTANQCVDTVCGDNGGTASP